ncbi:MAG: hypothetical protein ACLP59_30435 [Bryobacteraceae bacterium]
MKSSTILISVGETDAVFRSVKEVPPPLRRKLLKSTNGLNAATILIADRRGREEVARAIQNLPSSLQRRFLKPYQEEPESVRGWLSRPWVRLAIAAFLAACSLAVIWFVFTHFKPSAFAPRASQRNYSATRSPNRAHSSLRPRLVTSKARLSRS